MLKKFIKNIGYFMSDLADTLKNNIPGNSSLLAVPTAVQSTAYYVIHPHKMRG
jgi:hypothetical protein